MGLALGDLDGDSDLDIVFSKTGSGPRQDRVCLNHGAATFSCDDVSADGYYKGRKVIADKVIEDDDE